MSESPVDVERLATERLIFFCDAVVAIAITLLALDLPVPPTRGYWDDYLAFVISFAVISAHWRGHHRVFRYVVRSGPIVGLSLLWLFFIVLTPLATRVITAEGDFAPRFIFYAAVQALAGLTFRPRSISPGDGTGCARRPRRRWYATPGSA